MLNRDLLAGNRCFGCGHENHRGLRIEVLPDPASEGRLRARFTPSSDMIGFPGIVLGGAISTALDCLSKWVSTVLGPNRGAGWVLRSATTVYHKPASPGEPLALAGWIQERGGRWDPLTVRAEARRGDGALCVEGEFKVVPLPPEKLAAIAGIERLPENWRAFLSGVD
jgi:acyl-CoA thioesterase FadM